MADVIYRDIDMCICVDYEYFISQIICYLIPSRSGLGAPCRMDNEYNGKTLQYCLILTALAYMTGFHKFKIQPAQMARMPLLLASGCRASNENC